MVCSELKCRAFAAKNLLGGQTGKKNSVASCVAQKKKKTKERKKKGKEEKRKSNSGGCFKFDYEFALGTINFKQEMRLLSSKDIIIHTNIFEERNSFFSYSLLLSALVDVQKFSS